MRLEKKELILLLIALLPSFAGLAVAEPWVFFPCFSLSWIASIWLCIEYDAKRARRAVAGILITIFFIFVGRHAYIAAQRNDSVIQSLTRSSSAPTWVDDFFKRLARNPSAPPDIREPLLNKEQQENAEKQSAVTKHEQEILDQPLSHQSLEEGRANDKKKEELKKQAEDIERQHREMNKPQEEINRRNQLKAAQEQGNGMERRFAAPYLSIIDQTIADLYNMLRTVSSEPIYHDFTSASPSIYTSKILKDGVLGGENIMRVGSHQEWEFHLKVEGPPIYMGVPRKHLVFQINAPTGGVSITNEYQPAMGNTGRLKVGNETCPLAECRKPIDLALRQLIQGCYDKDQLKSNITPPSPTPDMATSPH